MLLNLEHTQTGHDRAKQSGAQKSMTAEEFSSLNVRKRVTDESSSLGSHNMGVIQINV